jgi:hypothetical protein
MQFNLTSNGTTNPQPQTGYRLRSFFVGGTFDGATLHYEVQPVAGADWFSAHSATEKDTKVISSHAHQWRLRVENAGASTDLTVYVL